MDDLGSELRKAREASGLSLREVATRTKISVTSLEALERNDPSRLPGGIFGRSFVRAYATEVGLDPEGTVERFVALLERYEEERAERRRAAQPAISADDQRFLDRQRRAVFVARIVMALAVAGLVALIAWGVRVIWPLRDAPSEVEVTTALPLPPGAVLPAAAPTASAPVQAGGATAAGPTTSAPKLVVELTATAACTVVLAADGRAEASRAYRAGEKIRVEADRDVLVDVSDAAAVTLVINGRATKPLGAAGAHVRTRITRDNAAQF